MITTPQPAAPRTIVVLLDPTSGDGEAALDKLTEDDRHVSLVVLLSGPCSSALRDYARAEGLDMSDAGWRYVDQVAARLTDAALQSGRQLTIEQIVATGPDTAYELASITHDRAVEQIIVPPSATRRDRAMLTKLARWSEIPVVVAELAHVSV
jgi:hypothetical protein